MPRLQIYDKGSLPFAPALVDIARSVIKYAQHWHQTIRSPIRAFDEGVFASNVMNTQSNAPGVFAYHCALLIELVLRLRQYSILWAVCTVLLKTKPWFQQFFLK